MHTLSSASRTCMASASAVECTATVGMPSSLQARSTRSAISPRLAIRIFSNMQHLTTRHAPRKRGIQDSRSEWSCAVPIASSVVTGSPASAGDDDGELLLDDHQRLAEFDRLGVL